MNLKRLVNETLRQISGWQIQTRNHIFETLLEISKEKNGIGAKTSDQGLRINNFQDTHKSFSNVHSHTLIPKYFFCKSGTLVHLIHIPLSKFNILAYKLFYLLHQQLNLQGIFGMHLLVGRFEVCADSRLVVDIQIMGKITN